MGRPEGKISLGRPKSRWEDNINMDLKEVDCDVGALLKLGPIAGSCKGSSEPPGSLRAN